MIFKPTLPMDLNPSMGSRPAVKRTAPQHFSRCVIQATLNPYQTLSLAFPHIAEMLGTAYLSSLGRLTYVVFLS